MCFFLFFFFRKLTGNKVIRAKNAALQLTAAATEIEKRRRRRAG